MKLPVWQVVIICLAAASSIAQPYLQKGVVKAATVTAHTIKHATVKVAKKIEGK